VCVCVRVGVRARTFKCVCACIFVCVCDYKTLHEQVTAVLQEMYAMALNSPSASHYQRKNQVYRAMQN
jgi:hypothetical protein